MKAGQREQAAALAARAATETSLSDSDSFSRLGWLLDSMQETGEHEKVAVQCAAAEANVNNPTAAGWLLGNMVNVGQREQAAVLAARAAAETNLSHPSGLDLLLDRLLQVGDHRHAIALLARDPAADVSLQDASSVIHLLYDMLRAGDLEQAGALADRAVDVSFHDWWGVTQPPAFRRKVGANEHVAVLVGRMPGAGMFQRFLDQQDSADRFRFGREADSAPAAPWGWDDLRLQGSLGQGRCRAPRPLQV